MSNARTCPNCGGPMPDDMLDGLCPRCVVRVAIAAPGEDAGAPLTEELSKTNTWYALQHFELKWNSHEFVDTTCPAKEQRFYRAVEVGVPTNVWEWCMDWFGPYPGGTVTDPTGPETGSDRVVRGGSLQFEAVVCRSALRHAYYPDSADYDRGFRAVLVAVP